MVQQNQRLLRISKEKLNRAKQLCSAKKALPNDWDVWFPETIPLAIPIDGTEIRTRDIENFVLERLKQRNDPHRYVEAAQCLALLHFLDSPHGDTIITSIYG